MERCPNSGTFADETAIMQRIMICGWCGQTVECSPVMGVIVTHEWPGETPDERKEA